MSDFDRLRSFFTSWPCIVVGFCLGGWPGFLLLLWKIASESSGEHRSGRKNMFKDILMEEMERSEREKTERENLYWDRDAQRWVIRDAAQSASAQEDLDYDDPAASYRYTYQDGKATRVTESAETKEASVRSQWQDVSWKDSFEKQEQKKRKKKEKADAKKAKREKKDARRGVRSPKIPDGKFLTAVGSILTAIFGCMSLYEILTGILFGSIQYYLATIFVLLMFTAVGAGMLVWGRFKKKRASDFRRLLQLVGDSDHVSVRALSDAACLSYRKTCDQLQEMIDAGYLGERAYINYAMGELVLDGTPLCAEAPEGTEEAPAAEEAEEDAGNADQEILRKIRAADEAIPDKEMSRKIRRVEEITGHILEYQQKHPERASELRKFLNYYLPTTLKILNTYAELDRQKVSGENINATKRRIEGMMDKVVEGFELQLDKLYADEMLDITSDISVMETMLSQDGLAPSSGMTIPKAPDAAVAAREAAAKEAARQNAARQAATDANAGFTTPDGIHLTLDPEQDNAAGGAAAQAAPHKP